MEHRKRLQRREIRDHRFLTCSCYRGLPLLGTPHARDLFAQRLALARSRRGFALLAWVAMPDHVHLLVVPGPNSTVPKLLTAIKQPVAQSLLRRWRDSREPVLDRLRTQRGTARFWQAGGGFDRNIRDADELARTVHYIHHNPVRAALCGTPTDWAWSSARWYAGDREGAVEIDAGL